MITAEQKKAWLAALRSGEYEQGVYELRRESKYCCLGVACEVFGPGLILHDTGLISEPEYVASDTGSSTHWYGTAQLAQLDVMTRAIALNDSGKSFSEIADFLEVNLPVE